MASSEERNAITFCGLEDIQCTNSAVGALSLASTLNASSAAAARFAFEPNWSVDGKAIAFVIEYHGARANIFEIDSEGGTLKRLTAGPKFDRRPAYSPDGTKLAFESDRDGNYEIYVMSLR